MHRHITSASKAATNRLRPHLALIDRLRFSTRHPLAPRLRLAANPAEAEGATTSLSRFPGTPTPPTQITAASRALISARLDRTTPPVPYSVRTGRGQAPARPGQARLAHMPDTAGVKPSAARSRLPPALFAPALHLATKLSAVFGTRAMGGTSTPARLVRTTDPAVRRHAISNHRQARLPPLSHTSRSRMVFEPDRPGVAHPGTEPDATRPASTRLSPTPASTPAKVQALAPHLAALFEAPTTPSATAAHTVTATRLRTSASLLRRPASLPEKLRTSARHGTVPQATAETGTRIPARAAKGRCLASAPPAAPRPSTPPVTANHATAALPPATPAPGMLPASPAPFHLADSSLDGARLARWLARALATDAARPPAAGAGFDPRRTPAWIPSFYTKGT